MDPAVKKQIFIALKKAQKELDNIYLLLDKEKSLNSSKRKVVFYFDGVIQGGGSQRKSTYAITDVNGNLIQSDSKYGEFDWQIESEALGFLKTMQLIVSMNEGQHFIIMSDAETVIKSFKKGNMGGKSKAPIMFNQAISLMHENNLDLEIKYVESKFNLADKYTR